MNSREIESPDNRRDKVPLDQVLAGIPPREIEVYIEELVLHGFDPGARWQIGDVLEQELRGLLAAKGIPPSWLSSPGAIEAGPIRNLSRTKPAVTGVQIAGATYHGGTK
ncbi:MAG TPA: hypothetical protein VH207_11320 [Chthoniobacterales bacterium]|jgi:hypothetical protein|nr:hypothetical protein [Chthoniobacterales bacterium]